MDDEGNHYFEWQMAAPQAAPQLTSPSCQLYASLSLLTGPLNYVFEVGTFFVHF